MQKEETANVFGFCMQFLTINAHNTAYSTYINSGHITGFFLKKILELHTKSRDGVLKNWSLIADGIELLASSEKG